jgi:hypothetical protein
MQQLLHYAALLCVCTLNRGEAILVAAAAAAAFSALHPTPILLPGKLVTLQM